MEYIEYYFSLALGQSSLYIFTNGIIVVYFIVVYLHNFLLIILKIINEWMSIGQNKFKEGVSR